MKYSPMSLSRPAHFLTGWDHALVVLRFLLDRRQKTLLFRPNLTILFLTNPYIRSAEKGEMHRLRPYATNAPVSF